MNLLAFFLKFLVEGLFCEGIHFGLKNSVGIAENLLECFWYNGTEKENLITDFIRN